MNYSQRQISSLLGVVYHFGLDLNPDYQRDYVWTISDKVNLVDSIFNHVEIGKFVLSHNGYGEGYMYEIVDGKQRTNAICEFYENKFSYNGLYFNDLSHYEQHHFSEYPISWAELREITYEQKLRYFISLNKTGKVMDAKHLQKIEDKLTNINNG